MTLKEYIENLNQFVKENPQTLDMQVIASKDDEGNDYSAVYFTPSIISSEVYEDYPKDSSQTNAVCIN
jgi:hypothetical protein